MHHYLRKAHKLIGVSILLIFISGHLYAQNEEHSVLFVNRGKNRQWLSFQSNHDALYKIISNEAFAHLKQRESYISTLRSQTDWQNYQQEIQKKFKATISKFTKTPLNAEITGVLEREHFTVEKVIYESHPGFYATASLFMPKVRQDPAPAIIYCSGHNVLGFRSETYQHIIINLVEKGFIVLAYDPIGQGERLQYLDPETGKSAIGSPTQEHSYSGVQTLMAGMSMADYFIWEGIRAVDYLATRPEVDMNRIGITGRSGGGTQAAMIAAVDERIYAAAPECYITNFSRLFQAIGPQDAEQNLFFSIAEKLDHPDFIHARAPKPTLILATTNDYFNIQGARETFEEVKRSYASFGKGNNIQMAEDIGKHESTLKNRMAMYAFFQEHLRLPGSNEDIGTTVFPAEELWATRTGQIGSSIKGETIFSLNEKNFSKEPVSDSLLMQQITRLSGIKFDRKLTASVFTGIITEDGITVEKHFLESEVEDFVLPIYIANKRANADKVMVWLNPVGNNKIYEHRLLNELMDKGFTIVSADLPGKGELYNPEYTGDGTVKDVPFNYLFGANLVGKSIAGIQAEALDLLMQFINQDQRFSTQKLFALVENISSAPFLHYTIFKNPFEKIVFGTQFLSEKELIFREYYNPEQAFYVVPGSLPFYNLNDLLKFHEKDSYMIVQETDEISDIKKIVNFLE